MLFRSEQVISDYLLRIFRACIPHLPKTAKPFGQQLQTSLQPMILKPSTASGVSVEAFPVSNFALANIVTGTPRDSRLSLCGSPASHPRVQAACYAPQVMYLCVQQCVVPAWILTTLTARLLVFASTPTEKISAQDTRALPVLILIVALLCEHCNFDQLCADGSPATNESLSEIRRELAGLTEVRDTLFYLVGLLTGFC